MFRRVLFRSECVNRKLVEPLGGEASLPNVPVFRIEKAAQRGGAEQRVIWPRSWCSSPGIGLWRVGKHVADCPLIFDACARKIRAQESREQPLEEEVHIEQEAWRPTRVFHRFEPDSPHF